MPSPKKPFRINVGFIIHEEIGNNYDFPFEFAKITLDDLELRNFEGIANVGKTPQGLFVQSDFSAETTLECVRCLTSFDHELDWSFTELYAFDKRSYTDSAILPEDAHIELAPLLREYALLEISISPVLKARLQGDFAPMRAKPQRKGLRSQTGRIDLPFAKLKDLLS